MIKRLNHCPECGADAIHFGVERQRVFDAVFAEGEPPVECVAFDVPLYACSNCFEVFLDLRSCRMLSAAQAKASGGRLVCDEKGRLIDAAEYYEEGET